MSARLLLVEDDPGMRKVTRVLLEKAGYKVWEAGSAEEAMNDLQRRIPDLIVSDIQLPGLSGVKMLELLRGQPATAHLPILLLTVLGKGAEKVRGFQTGADDYVTKPYDPPELIARIEALLRRSGRSGGPSTALDLEGLHVDTQRRDVTVDGRTVPLRRKEFELLVFLLRHPGQLLTRERISQALWSDEVVVTDNTLSSHIMNLRSKLGPYGKRIQTLIGEGYRLEDS